MLYKNILVAFDGSQPAFDALDVAKRLVGDDPDARIRVLSVVSAGYLASELESTNKNKNTAPIAFGIGSAYNEAIEEAKGSANQQLHEAVGATFDDVACNVSMETVFASKAARGIVDYAKASGSDLIVMGRRGRGAMGMLGSVSYAVLHEADIPVLSVK